MFSTFFSRCNYTEQWVVIR